MTDSSKSVTVRHGHFTLDLVSRGSLRLRRGKLIRPVRLELESEAGSGRGYL